MTVDGQAVELLFGLLVIFIDLRVVISG